MCWKSVLLVLLLDLVSQFSLIWLDVHTGVCHFTEAYSDIIPSIVTHETVIARGQPYLLPNSIININKKAKHKFELDQFGCALFHSIEYRTNTYSLSNHWITKDDWSGSDGSAAATTDSVQQDIKCSVTVLGKQVKNCLRIRVFSWYTKFVFENKLGIVVSDINFNSM